MAKHENNGKCQACLEIIYRYPDPNRELVLWFMDLQAEHPEAHVSCSGRGKVDQEAAFQRGASRAHYGESAHNFNAALDLWRRADQGSYTLPPEWFDAVIKPNIPAWMTWGATWQHFKELPHVELADWKDRVASGELKLVEPA